MNKITTIKKEIPCDVSKKKKMNKIGIKKKIPSDISKEEKVDEITIKKEIPCDLLKEEKMNEITIKKEIPSDLSKEEKMNEITIKKEIPSDLLKEEKMNEVTIKKEIPCAIVLKRRKKMNESTIKKEIRSDISKEKKMNGITIKNEMPSNILKEKIKINEITIKKEIPCDIVLKWRKKMNEITIKKEIPCDIVLKRRKMNEITIKEEIPCDIVLKRRKMNEITIKKEIPCDIVLKRRKKTNTITPIKKDIHSDISTEEKMNEITTKKEIPSDISKMKKKMKKSNTSCSSVSAYKEIHSDIVFEVLTRLPIKDLVRCKCVSTSWSSLIRQPEFMKAHRACGGILVHLLPIYSPLRGNNISDMMKGFFYASINYGKNYQVFTHRVRLPYIGGYNDITPVVNGLACLYTGHQVSLFNISTLELMELPSSNLHGEGLISTVWYALGFDPKDNVYKLLKVSKVANQLVYEILTLETSSRSAWRWRVIVQEGLPHFNSVSVQSYFVNGIIYCKFRAPNTYCDEGKQSLLAFDVHEERFTIFNLPRVPSHIRSIFDRSFTVFGQFEGRLALARVKKTQFETVLELWALEDHQNSTWSKHKIDMPNELVRYFYKVTPIGNLPSGELLLCCSNASQQTNPFYIYDPISKKFRKLMVELPSSLELTGLSASTHITCLMEKITPLHDLVGLRKND